MSRAHLVVQASVLLIFTLVSAQWSSSQGTSATHALTLSADKESVVRFFYQPNDSNYFHVALLFRVVEGSDPRWNTAPVFDVGRTAYVSFSEMRQLMTALSAANLSWDESAKIEGLETYKNIHSYRGMGVKVLSANETAKTTIAADKICETLAPLDAALQTPRALWEFQLFRTQYHCQVSNSNPKAYPDRVP
ncbi:MAG: hypothetical protein LAN83_06330 [Acidobacteriia bacterium]|nr:hypothetical protein [Terriglobia bacterium]